MSEQSQEPTMEEILASIRRIISEDDAPGAEAKADGPPTAAEPAPPEAAPPAPVAAAPPEEDDDALELTDKVESHGDLDIYSAPPAPEPAPAPAPLAYRAPEPPAAAPSLESLVSERAASAAASSFGQLSAAIAMPTEGRTLEDLVREMLRPMLQQWLDTNLPTIVQASVEAEVSRIARTRVR